jgi:hypothetical protein
MHGHIGQIGASSIISHTRLDRCVDQDDIRDASITISYSSLLRKFH